MLDADFKKLISNAHQLEDEFIKLLRNEEVKTLFIYLAEQLHLVTMTL